MMNNNNSLQEFLAGCVGGTVGITISYPIDTFKTWRQTNQPIRMNKLYSGYSSPLFGMMVEKSVLFWGYDFARKNTNLNIFNSGLIAGLMTTVIVTPFERIKIRSQTTGDKAVTTLVKTLRNDGLASMYRGWGATLFREVPGYGIYFSTYNLGRERVPKVLELITYKNHTPSYYISPTSINILSTVVSGAGAGMTSWAFIYPSDSVKTIAQNENISTSIAFWKLWTTQGTKGFYRGFTPAIIRAAILHSGVFLGYEMSKTFFDKP